MNKTQKEALTSHCRFHLLVSFVPDMLVFQQHINIILLCHSSSYINIGNQSEESWYQDEFTAREVKVPGWWERQTTKDKPTGRVQMCPILPIVTNFDLAAMQLHSHGDKLQLSKTSWEKMPKVASVHTNIPYSWMQNTSEEYKAISVSRDISSFSALPLLGHHQAFQIPGKVIQEIIWWTHQHLKASLMPIREIHEERVQKKYKR